MKKGTYAEAIQAGFTPTQAGLFARACCEIKNEAWRHFEGQLKPQLNITIEWVQWIILMSVFGSGVIVGIFV